MENILSSISTIVLGIVAVAGIWLNYRKEGRESRHDNSADLKADYDRRNALLGESEKKCAALEEKNNMLEDELSRSNRERMALLTELMELRLKNK
jgi:cbb3-type cytochrome oxidase subunit 3